MHMLLVARRGRARDRFVEELARLGADCQVVETPEELTQAARLCRYNGVLFDVPTIVREKHFDKGALQKLAEIYPSARLKYDATTDAVFALGTDAGPPSRDGLSVFVAACRDFLPRIIRRGERVEAHLPAILWRTRPPVGDPGDSGPGCERTCTLNVSLLGCFLFTTAQWAIGAQAWVVFPDVAEEPVPMRVAWHEPWAKRRTAPGVGLAFLETPPALVAELGRLGCVTGEMALACVDKGL